MEKDRRRTWAEIDLSALKHNYAALRSMLPAGCKLLAPVKADGYGHGAVAVAKCLEKLGIDYLAVAYLDEAVELRQAGVETPILILGRTDPCWTEELLQYNITQAVCCWEDAKAYSEAALSLGGRLKVHIKADTGMTRLGLLCDASGMEGTIEAIEKIRAFEGLDCEGIFTHFAAAENNEAYTMLQFTRFLDLLDRLEEKGLIFEIRHCAASAAVLNYPCTCLDMVRPGIALYGHYPDPTWEEADEVRLRPMMTLKTRVTAVKTVPAGTAVSYGCTCVLERESRLAVLGIGYGDGLPRRCAEGLQVWMGEGYAPVVGRICMDLCMVDVTDLPGVRVGDEVEIFGPHIPAEHVADKAGTIQYEILCGVSKRVPRLYLE